MEMGTGKTQVAVELINQNKKYIDYVLFFCPVSTKKNLAEEIKKCNICSVEFEIFGWETLSQSDRKYLELLDRIESKKLFIVADESSFIKNGSTKRFKRLLNISKNSLFRIIMNGTPIIKNEIDLYYQMEFLSPKILDMTEQNFIKNYFTEYKFNMKVWYEFSEINANHLYSKIKNYLIHMSSECNFILL
jgi:SNF2 family DNA or RNA helicase